MSAPSDITRFEDALQGLRRGDFSRLEPLFRRVDGAAPRVIQWHEEGRFEGHSRELAEALTCACFNGRTDTAEYFLEQGVAPSGGAGTGLDALHWAVNRGQLEAVRLLVRYKAPLETRSMYGGTALGTAVWSAVNEPRPEHLAIIEALLAAGAQVEAAEYPCGNEHIDAVLRRYGA